MANKKTTVKTKEVKGKANVKQPSKKSNLPLVLTAVAVVCVAVVVVIFGNRFDSSSEGSGDGQTIAAGEVLSIPIADISSTVTFFPIEVDGTQMEVLAVQASDGSIRTAFNTCQSCYTSGRGYYVQEGADLVCQNCGFHFTPDQVEIQSGGCNPWPIFAENKTVTEDSIVISYDFLKESAGIFARWKL